MTIGSPAIGNITTTVTGSATSDNQTNGDQLSQIVDSSGNEVTVTGNKLDVNASIDTTGLATSAKQDTGNTSLGSIDGKITACNTGAIAGAVTANAGTNLNTSALLTETVFTGRVGEVQATPTANTILSRLKTIADNQLPDGHNVTVDNISLAVTGTFWQATQPVSGTVTANLSATDNSVLDQIELNTDPLLVVGGGTEATAQRVTIASDSTGVLSVDDNGGTLTVDGTVTANLSATDNAVLDNIALYTAGSETALELLDNAVDGNYLNVNANLSGTDISATNPMPVRPNEYELAGNTTHVKKYYTSAGAATDGIIWSPAAGKRWYVTDIFINVSAAATVTLEDDLAGGDSAVWKAELSANSGWSHSFNTPLFSGEDEADLIITTSAGNVYVTVTGYEI